MTASTLWGTVGVSSRLISQLTYTNWLSLALFRMIIAAPVLLFVGQRLLGRQMWSISRRDLGLMMIIGVLSATSQSLYFAAIPYTGIAVATLLAICVAPVVVTVITTILNRQRPDNLTLLSIVLALVGTALLVLGSQVANIQSVSLIGVLFGIGSACTYAGIILIGRFLSDRYNALQVMGVAFGTGAILLAALGSFVGFVGSYPVTGWVLLLYIGLIPTALGYRLFMSGIRTLPAPVASVAALLEPLTATVLAWILFNERLSIVGIAGAVMLLTAIYLLSTKEKQPAIETIPV
jgi:DME family drug/metabolite transporter